MQDQQFSKNGSLCVEHRLTALDTPKSWNPVKYYDVSSHLDTSQCITPYCYTDTYLLYFRNTGSVVEARYGPGTGQIWLNNVQCVGNELSIANCSHGGWGVNNCSHSKDVSVLCGTSPLQYGNFTNIMLSRH